MRLITMLLTFLCSFSAYSADLPMNVDLTSHWVGYSALGIFFLAYFLVIVEDKIHLRKSKPVLLAAGLIWIIIAIYYASNGDTESVEIALQQTFLEYAELFFFLLVAMTYINSMLERGVFNSLRNWLVSKNLSWRAMFWLTGLLAFIISPVADNLTTALVMCAVILAVGKTQIKFVSLSCINIVVAANAGGAFSPFGDITTLMVWQNDLVEFTAFFNLFLPSLVNFVIPAFIMQFAIPKGAPSAVQGEINVLKRGGLFIVGLFFLTILTAVSVQNFLHIPPVFGMMTGLAYVKFYGYYLRKTGHVNIDSSDNPTTNSIPDNFDIFDKIAKAEWDTLFFFYGVILAVGGLGFIGYLSVASAFMYGELGATQANILVGLLSAIVDNIPVMFAVISMDPQMDQWQWLLVTLTAGVGGSLFSIGSAAGVALMGQARGKYTFFSHLKWTPVIALGYAGSIAVHYWLNT